jgi:hypothetical protein
MQMKHDLETFSREIVSLIRTSGDTGGSGDRLKSSLRENAFFVPAYRKGVSLPKSDWGHGSAASGDRKSEHLPLVAELVPGVPTATSDFRNGDSSEIESDAPAEWHAILAELKRREPVGWLGAERWGSLLSDAQSFLSRWGGVAHSLGWTSLDLFGVHPIAPAVRFDVMGLIPMLNRAEILALTGETATMRRISGATLTYRRPDQGGAVLLSQLPPRVGPSQGAPKLLR